MNTHKTFKAGSNSQSLFYRLFDILAVTFALVITASLYQIPLQRGYLLVLLIVLLAFTYLSEAFNLYRSWRAGRFRDQVFYAWGTLLLSFASLFAFSLVFNLDDQLKPTNTAVWFSIALCLLFSWRLCVRLYKSNKRKLGVGMQKVAIIGATEVGANIFKEISAHNELGYDCIGFFEDREPSRLFDDMHLHVAGSIETAVERARNGELDVLFIALPLKADKRIKDILVRLGDSTVDVHFVPDFLLSNFMHARIDHVGNVDTLSVFESPYLGVKQWLKRTEDLIIGSMILMLISIPLIVIAIGIKLTSKGPVFFKQYRYGLGGQKIKVWKFRSMTVMENSDVVTQAKKNDSRITPFGGFLRRTSLDELPQFINVITGDMSIVGPRPHAVSHNEEYRKKVEYYMLRHKVKPGITGWAQINGWRGETDTIEKMEKRVEFDLHYIKHWSIWLDIKIIFLTVFKGFVGENAY